MSISTITVGGNSVNLVAMPGAPGLSSVDFTAYDAVGIVTSPFTGGMQAQAWPGGDMWSGIARVPPLAEADADDWITFLEELRGEANAFQMGDPAQPAARGSMAGSPLVDNTLNNGNPAGSQMLGIKGLAANATGVLLAGDYIQVGYRLYRVLGVVNADASGQAVFPIWPSLREQPYNDGTAASWLNATGAAAKTSSATLGGYTWGVIWDGFILKPAPALPADAVIQGIYPVIIASGTFDICYQALAYGAVTFPGLGLSGSEFTAPYSTNPINPGASFASTEFYGPSVGVSLSALSGQGIGMAISSSLFNESIDDAIAATGVGFAIYYTSAAPATDPLMPPPFAVPSGQGLAWSVPLNYEVSGPPATNGTVAAAAAVSNGGLVLENPLGVWRLADNKRDYATDIRKVTPLQFAFQEYR